MQTRMTYDLYPYVRERLLRHLTSQIIHMLPIEVWDLIFQYVKNYNIPDAMCCPSTGVLLKHPVVFKDPEMAPIVYEQKATKGRIMNGYRKKTLSVPMMSSIVKFLEDSSVDNLLKTLKQEGQANSTNISQELKWELDSISPSKPSSQHILNFLNLYDAPICAKRSNRVPQNNDGYFIKKLPEIAGIIAVTRMLFDIYRLNIDRRFVWMALLHGVNVMQNISTIINYFFPDNLISKLSSKVKKILRGPDPDLLNNSTSTNNLISDLLPLAKRFVLRNNTSLRSAYLQSSTASMLLGATILTSSYVRTVLPEVEFLKFPSIYFGSCHALEESKEIRNNPYKLFTPRRDENGFIEPYHKTAVRRLSQFSSIFLAVLISWVSNENPWLALLAFATTFVYQADINALSKETSRELPSDKKGQRRL